MDLLLLIYREYNRIVHVKVYRDEDTFSVVVADSKGGIDCNYSSTHP